MNVHIIALGLLFGSLLGILLGVIPREKLSKIFGHQVEEYLFIFTSGLFLGSVISVVGGEFLEFDLSFFLFYAVGLGVGWISGRGKLPSNPCCSPCIDHWELGLLSILSISFCSFSDGIFIGLVMPSVFSVLFMAMWLHKLTVSFLLMTLVKMAPFSRSQKIGVAVLFMALTPVIIYSSQVFDHYLEGLKTPLLALSSGILSYVMVSGLWPTLRHYHKKGEVSKWAFYGLFIGALLLGSMHLFLHLQPDHIH